MTTSKTSRSVQQRCCQLELENRALRALLERHGIALPASLTSEDAGSGQQAAETPRNQDSQSAAAQARKGKLPGPASSNTLSSAAQIALFRAVYRGRNDVYARRWEKPAKNKPGYAPARPTPWQAEAESETAGGFVDRQGRRHFPLTDDVFERHLPGQEVIGLNPLDRTGRCHLLVVDFERTKKRHLRR